MMREYHVRFGGRWKPVTVSRPPPLFFMVMPALIGGFLRRGQREFVHKMQTPISTPIPDRKESRLNAVVISNEIWL